MKTHRTSPIHTRGITAMQLVVGFAVAIVLFAIGYPVLNVFRQRAHKQVAIERVRALSGAMLTFAQQNNGALPAEDSPGNDTWSRIGTPPAKSAWYNALPPLIGRKPAGDFAGNSDAFYTEENILFLPGANYPDKKKFLTPMFAIAMNTKLERTGPDGQAERAKLTDIANPARTVAFLEQGLLNESRTLQVQTKSDYDGSPKGSAKSFVGRYGGQGVLGFFDGHAELADASALLTGTGYFPFPQTNVIWTAKPDENPNKTNAQREREKGK